MTIDATDGDGDKATVVVKVGHLGPVADVTDTNVHACDGTLDQMGTSTQQSIAIPVQLSATVTSTEPVSMIIALDASDAVEPSSEAPSPGTVGAPDTEPSWVQVFADGPECTGASQAAAVFKWNNAAPGQTNTWIAYIIAPSAVTPDDPTGISGDAGLETIQPQLELGTSTADYTVDNAGSANMVSCSDELGDSNTMVSVDPVAALAQGCTK